MFTGIVETVGTLVEVKTTSGGLRISIETALAPEVSVGDSVAVSGVCLTVILVDGKNVLADVGPETARVTTLGALRRGQPVNLERSMRPDGRIGGHFVLGHADGVGTVDEVRPEGESQWLTVGFAPALAPFLIRRGSVTVDGISLTIAGLGDRQFDVQVIPFTWSNTSLKTLKKGDRVNLECDMIGKYVARAMDLRSRG